MPKSNSLSGPERYNFMLALTGYLINKSKVPIKEVARHFEVSEQELRSALVTISLSGVGRYGPDELFFLDYELLENGIVDISFAPTISSVPRLSAKQAAAIASGLNFLVELVGEEDQLEIKSIISMLNKGSQGALELPIQIQPAASSENLLKLRKAISLGHVISCDYVNSSGVVSKRIIEPQFLQSQDSLWFLHGYCQTKESIRVFRVDRMRSVLPTGERATKDRQEMGFGDSIYTSKSGDTNVLFEVDPEGYGLIFDFMPDISEELSGTMKVTIPIGNLENLPRLVAKYSGHVRVLAPAVAKELVRNYALAALGENSATPADVD